MTATESDAGTDGAGVDVTGYAALKRGGPLQPWTFSLRPPRPQDVTFDVLYCGICHTDLHMIDAWGRHFPLVPGHEIVGRVTSVGGEVEGFAEGDLVAVGTIVDSCRVCEPCRNGLESYCQAVAVGAYDGIDRVDGSITRGGYARAGICDQRFVHHVPEGIDPAGAAPLLCAGITTYSPLRHWGVGPGSTVGVIGIGGLGHLGIKFAHAFGARVVAFTTSAAKAEQATTLGADDVVLSTDAEQANRLDFVLDTVSAIHPLTPYLAALRMDGTLCSVGLPDRFDVSPIALALGRRSLASSGSGGTVETREMLAYCAERGITADVETVRPTDLGTALKRLTAGDVRYRFVLDMVHAV
jgi:alcohol dehydrogenase (NADP+)